MTDFFVYGTLQLDPSLTDCGTWRGAASTAGFGLYDFGSFPAMVPGEGTVHGMLWRPFETQRVRITRELDRREGHPTFYRRDRVLVEGPRGSELAFAYVYQRSVTPEEFVPSGRWEPRPWLSRHYRRAA